MLPTPIAVQAPWKTVFRGCAGVGSDLFNAWESGNATANRVLSGSLSHVCSGHERGSIVDMWNDLAIQKVCVHAILIVDIRNRQVIWGEVLTIPLLCTLCVRRGRYSRK